MSVIGRSFTIGGTEAGIPTVVEPTLNDLSLNSNDTREESDSAFCEKGPEGKRDPRSYESPVICFQIIPRSGRYTIVKARERITTMGDSCDLKHPECGPVDFGIAETALAY